MKKNTPLRIIIFLFLITFCLNHTTSQVTNIPDREFESLLIDNGFDKSGVLDGKINSSDIQNVSTIKIRLKGNKVITDLTGIEDFINLRHLDLRNCSLDSLDLSHNTMLETLNISNSKIPILDLQGNVSLRNIESSGANTIESLDIRGLIYLEELSLSKCKLKNISFGSNKSLKKLYLKKNELKSINISEAVNLKQLDFSDNMISHIDVSNNLKLQILSCSRNSISDELDFSFHYFLTRLELENNKITKINIQNGNNDDLQFFRIFNNPLKCVQVDSRVGAFRSKNWKTGLPGTIYSENCF